MSYFVIALLNVPAPTPGDESRKEERICFLADTRESWPVEVGVKHYADHRCKLFYTAYKAENNLGHITIGVCVMGTTYPMPKFPNASINMIVEEFLKYIRKDKILIKDAQHFVVNFYKYTCNQYEKDQAILFWKTTVFGVGMYADGKPILFGYNGKIVDKTNEKYLEGNGSFSPVSLSALNPNTSLHEALRLMEERIGDDFRPLFDGDDSAKGQLEKILMYSRQYPWKTGNYQNLYDKAEHEISSDGDYLELGQKSIENKHFTIKKSNVIKPTIPGSDDPKMGSFYQSYASNNNSTTSMESSAYSTNMSSVWHHPSFISSPQQPCYMQAEFSFTALDENKLSFKEGAIIKIISKNHSSGWWIGELNGKQGLVSPSLLQPLSSSEQQDYSALTF